MASIQKRPDGTWRARYRDESNKEHSKHFKRKTDAQQWLNEVTAAIITGQYVDPGAGKITFREFFTSWSARQVWEQSTLRSAAITVKSLPFADLPLKAIRRSHVEAWIKGMSVDTTARKAYAASTITTRYQHVRKVFRAAVRDKLLAMDPSESISLPRRRRLEYSIEIPTPDEVRKLLTVADPWFVPLVAVCAFAGLRKGEASAVQVDDIDFLGRTLHVQRQVQREGRDMVARPPKYGSERSVALPDDLVMMLAEHVRTRVVHCDGWLFADDDGPIDDNAVDHRWRVTRTKAGVVANLHSLRHFFASGLIAQGCDVVTVQRALGHASASTTLDTYAHLWPSAEDRTRKAASTIMDEVFGRPADSLRTLPDAMTL